MKHDNLSLKPLTLTPLLLITCYWFYTSISFGYFLSKIFYNFFDTIHKNNSSKLIQLRKKFHFKNIIRTIIHFCWKCIQNWLLRIFKKSLLLMRALDGSLTAIQIFLKKFLKYPFRFKRNFRLFKNLLNIFTETFLVFCSVMNEILFFNNLVKWLIQWRNLIQFLMKESLFITPIVYALYFILLGLFGILGGFLLGIYGRDHEIEHIYLFFLLLLLHILSHNEFHYTLLRNLSDSSLSPNIAESFEKFSFQPLSQIESRPLKLILKETEQRTQIPFPILDDPSVNIQIHFIYEESIDYIFELFELYQNLNEKVKY
jgi:hypothetical protein